MLRTVSVVVFFVVGGSALFFALYLRRYRTDLIEGQNFLAGKSFWADVNILNPNNYTARGRSLLRLIYLGLLIQFVAGLLYVFAP